MADWLGTYTVATYLRDYLSFKKARAFVRSLNLTSETEWREYCRLGKRPSDEPRQRIGLGRKGFGHDRNADLLDFGLADNGSISFFVDVFAALGARPCRAWTIRGGSAL